MRYVLSPKTRLPGHARVRGLARCPGSWRQCAQENAASAVAARRWPRDRAPLAVGAPRPTAVGRWPTQHKHTAYAGGFVNEPLQGELYNASFEHRLST